MQSSRMGYFGNTYIEPYRVCFKYKEIKIYRRYPFQHHKPKHNLNRATFPRCTSPSRGLFEQIVCHHFLPLLSRLAIIITNINSMESPGLSRLIFVIAENYFAYYTISTYTPNQIYLICSFRSKYTIVK